MKEWQRRGIDMLMRADLPPERALSLAKAWMFPLKTCRSPELEDWYFQRTSAEIRKGSEGGRYQLEYWLALEYADSPAIRKYLSDLMADRSLGPRVRDTGGSILFAKYSGPEHRREYFRALESNSFPTQSLVDSRTWWELKTDADGFIAEFAQRVRQNPAFARHLAFRQVVESSDGRS